MSGAVRAGLIFGGVSLVVVPLFAALNLLIPLGCLCGTVAAALLGGAAGFYGLRWDRAQTLGRGVLAGSLAGIGALVGGAVFIIGFFAIILNDPVGQELLRQQIDVAIKQQGQNITPEQAESMAALMRGAVGPVAGLCFGVLNLIVALSFGVLGALVARRDQPGPGGPPATPPSDPYGPPPLSPQ